MKMRGPARRSLFYAAILLAVFVWVIVRVQKLDGWLGLRPLSSPWLRVPGLLFVMLGAALGAWLFGVFATRGRGTPFVADSTQHLVVSGPLRFVRNPLYVAQVLVLGGSGLCFGSPSLLVLVLIWFVLLHLFVVRYEEPGLVRRFGAAYEEYCLRVPRWVPRLTNKALRPTASRRGSNSRGG
jgi:protein-S-isoprenylcysteine O-methyltransferase Ste14